MNRRLVLSMLLLSLLGQAGGAMAQGYWRDLPPDERRQMRQQMRDHWQQDNEMRRDEPGRRWQDVPPEDRRQMRQEMREQRGWSPDGREGPGRHGGRRD